ncbi:unnamed protein product [Dibothriocephalus latus]|uniref:Uncharacterized protein n=1 Tax=Dibothriocephalus latus TaxID=60516 RepID=A0A3P7MEL0_DIBLA|nr:unnamed protein product [Dibothriocephalus latus]
MCVLVARRQSVWPITFKDDSHENHLVDAVLLATLTHVGPSPLAAIRVLVRQSTSSNLFSTTSLQNKLFLPPGTSLLLFQHGAGPEDCNGKGFAY